MVSQHVHSLSVLNFSANVASFTFVITVNNGGLKKKLQAQGKLVYQCLHVRKQSKLYKWKML